MGRCWREEAHSWNGFGFERSDAPPVVQVLPSLGRSFWLAARQRLERWSPPFCPPRWDGAVAQALWAAAWAVAGFVAIWTGLFIYHLWRYRSSGFRDHDWLARHDDSDPGGAFYLELSPRSAASPCPGVDLELWVKSHGNWELVDDHDVVLMPEKVIRCRFDLNHEVFPSGFYDIRWFRSDDRGKLVEITRERFQLRNHSVGRRPESVSRINRNPRALPTSEDEVRPRRAAEVR
jgi:hypothetical protein